MVPPQVPQIIGLLFITNILNRHFLLYVFFVCFSWYINGTKVDSKTDYRYSFLEGDLIITNASEISDYGRYQCKAENSFGIILSRDALLQFACEYFFPTEYIHVYFTVKRRKKNFIKLHLTLPLYKTLHLLQYILLSPSHFTSVRLWRLINTTTLSTVRFCC